MGLLTTVLTVAICCLSLHTSTATPTIVKVIRRIQENRIYLEETVRRQWRVEEDPEVNMDAQQLITSKGYPYAEYDVTTPDGYIITVHRIPYGRGQKPGLREAVFVQHGLVGASTDFLLNPANESLGFILADAGYDVWFGNIRGNTYGRRHVKLHPSQEAFWDFSWDEHSLIDLPTTVNHVLRKTNQTEIFYIGFSQGTMMGFAGFSHNLTLAKQIKAFFAMGPVTTVEYSTSPVTYLSPLAGVLGQWLASLGEFLPSNTIMKWIARNACNDMVEKYLCENFLFLLCGQDTKQLNTTRLPVYISHNPAGTSFKNMVHFAQIVDSGKFQMYNYGSAEKNRQHYNQSEAPEYDVTKLVTPVALFWGGKDKLADKKDISLNLIPKLKHLIGSDFVPSFEHLDFIWGLDAKDFVYKQLLNIMKRI